MRRGRAYVWTVAAVAGLVSAAQAMAPPNATYRGQKQCISCHRTPNPAIINKYVPSPMAQAMVDINDADEDKVAAVLKADLATAPFGKDKVAFIFGAGRDEQAYLDKGLMVLPQMWLVREKKWVDTPAVDAGQQCLGCHVTGYNPKTHASKALGVGCEMCHGPGSAHISTLKKGETLDPGDIDDAHVRAYICGQCHAKGLAKDGVTPFAVDYRPGGDLLALFDLAKVNGPGRNQQLNDLMTSKHWRKGIVCDTCHDAHGDTGHPSQLKKPIIEMCLTCHAKRITDLPTHLAKVGRKPAADVTCASCHMPHGRHLFSKEAAQASDVGR